MPWRARSLAPRQYVLSFYWALSTMSSLGYGKGPVAVQVQEFALAIFAQLTGACVYAIIFGNIAQLMQKMDAGGARYQQQLDKINEVRFAPLLLPRSRRDPSVGTAAGKLRTPTNGRAF
jgi:hypothetical protein